jgi:hypothetical protein
VCWFLLPPLIHHRQSLEKGICFTLLYDNSVGIDNLRHLMGLQSRCDRWNVVPEKALITLGGSFANTPLWLCSREHMHQCPRNIHTRPTPLVLPLLNDSADLVLMPFNGNAILHVHQNPIQHPVAYEVEALAGSGFKYTSCTARSFICDLKYRCILPLTKSNQGKHLTNRESWHQCTKANTSGCANSCQVCRKRASAAYLAMSHYLHRPHRSVCVSLNTK